MGTCFAVTLRNGIFDATKAEKKRKITFLRWKWRNDPFGPAKAKSARRVLRT